VDGYSWGPVALADVQISGETAQSVPLQVIGDPSFTNIPAACSGTGTEEDTVAAFVDTITRSTEQAMDRLATRQAPLQSIPLDHSILPQVIPHPEVIHHLEVHIPLLVGHIRQLEDILRASTLHNQGILPPVVGHILPAILLLAEGHILPAILLPVEGRIRPVDPNPHRTTPAIDIRKRCSPTSVEIKSAQPARADEKLDLNRN